MPPNFVYIDSCTKRFDGRRQMGKASKWLQKLLRRKREDKEENKGLGASSNSKRLVPLDLLEYRSEQNNGANHLVTIFVAAKYEQEYTTTVHVPNNEASTYRVVSARFAAAKHFRAIADAAATKIQAFFRAHLVIYTNVFSPFLILICDTANFLYSNGFNSSQLKNLPYSNFLCRNGFKLKNFLCINAAVNITKWAWVPAHITLYILIKQYCIYFCCITETPTVLYSSNEKLLYGSVVDLKEVRHLCPLNSAYFPDSLAFVEEDRLSIGTMDYPRFTIHSIPLEEEAVKVCQQDYSRTYALC
ncbi:hypothetical protein POM88_044573 [Heracleum sosnowskyi]|uniref:Uncharacterized protein n=1 Tax=Heracleum sosnowskyi TaxID=360622 RepID=A0AAD8H447_9APIA|nr:hypothetical protein POM88_044573 [Heracleum sosnowskyi]